MAVATPLPGPRWTTVTLDIPQNGNLLGVTATVRRIIAAGLFRSSEWDESYFWDGSGWFNAETGYRALRQISDAIDAKVRLARRAGEIQ